MVMMKHTRSQPALAFAADSSQLSSVLSDWLSLGYLRNEKTVKPKANHQRKCSMSAVFMCNQGAGCLDQDLTDVVIITSQYLLSVNFESLLQDFNCALVDVVFVHLTYCMLPK